VILPENVGNVKAGFKMSVTVTLSEAKDLLFAAEKQNLRAALSE
jgi:hypothetical protein